MAETERSWIEAARYVRDNHAASLVHVPTGRLVSKQKTRLVFAYLDSIREDDEEYVEEYERKNPCPGDCLMLDAITANMLCTVYDALNPANQKTFAGFRLQFAVKTGWKFIK